ncbi:sulfatase [Oleiharenicola lentus]|uniref:sulfatase n=1 Tax=Oleiharenicola lentus TaxID=2508720 RepID=UPI003F671DC2
MQKLSSHVLASVAVSWFVATAGFAEPKTPTKPNILFIAIDDQNDWVGPLKGHPLVKTPNLDQLAARGTTFTNAHCQAPICHPSRTSLMLSLRPTTTGIYGMSPWFRTLDRWKDRVTLPQHFKANGYRTLTSGKVYHGAPKEAKAREKEFDIWGPSQGTGVKPAKKLVPVPDGEDLGSMEWGVFPHNDEDKGDYKLASWAIEQLRTAPKDQPFFLSVGFFLPHVPCYITQPWYDLYPDDDRLLPPVKADDRDDTPRFAWYLHWSLPEPRLKMVQAANQWRNLVRSYLASTSFIDAQIGRVLAQLEASGLAENTVVVVWGDNGWHFGEKGITGKNTLWERSTRIPLIFAGPGVHADSRVSQPAELLDIYPTLAELAGLPARNDLEGTSLTPQLREPQAKRVRPALTSHNQGNHAVRSDHWRYIRYADGTEELYDEKTDPNEWTNLANRPEFSKVLAEHRRWLPHIDADLVPKSARRILTYDPATDEATWENKKITRTDPIPGI